MRYLNRSIGQWTRAIGIVCALVLLAPFASRAADVEAGPEVGGLRLRMIVEPTAKAENEGFKVRIDLTNVSQRTITLSTAWDDKATGSVQEYLEAATSIECYPAIEPLRAGTAATQGDERPKQDTLELKAGESISMSWQTAGRQLKNRTASIFVQNPTFPFPGLYSVHATLEVATSAGTSHLRSNEQLVPVGGSHAMPKHTYGALTISRRDTAELGLGAIHKVEVGDQFDSVNKEAHWRLIITKVHEKYSEGSWKFMSSVSPRAGQERPERGTFVTFVGRSNTGK